MPAKYKEKTLKGRSPVIAIDFDGVIHPYTRGYRGPGVYMPPNEGTASSLQALKALGYTIMIYSCRGNDEHEAMEAYFTEYDIPYDYINDNNNEGAPEGWSPSPTKLHADIYLDDRALKFDGDWKATLNAIESYTLWYKTTDKSVVDRHLVGLAATHESETDRATSHLRNITLPHIRNILTQTNNIVAQAKLSSIINTLVGLTDLLESN